MPSVKVTEVVVSHIWDDASKTEIQIKRVEFESTGEFVSVKSGFDTVYFKPESWPEIRDQVQEMMNQIHEDRREK